jgi:hypothetical protein
MAPTASYEIRPVDGIWEIRLAGDSQTEYAPTRELAVTRARTLVRQHGGGRVVLRDAAGTVQQEFVHEEGAPPRSR